MTEDDDVAELWDVLRPPPPPEELEKRRLKMVAAAVKEPEFTCQRCEGPGIEGHTCPYDDDVNGGSDGECHCCEECMQECANDI